VHKKKFGYARQTGALVVSTEKEKGERAKAKGWSGREGVLKVNASQGKEDHQGRDVAPGRHHQKQRSIQEKTKD